MEKLKSVFKNFTQPKILDVGTGVGNFIFFLEAACLDFSEIIGIDVSENAIKAATNNFKDHPNIHFEKMDGLHMTYPDQTFDIVCLSNSLHHLTDIFGTLKEMGRVCKNNGIILINEMRSDELNPRQIGHRLIHHFSAEIDRELGLFHQDTYPLAEMKSIIKQNSSFQMVAVWNLAMEEESESQSPEQIQSMVTLLDRLVSRVKEQDKVAVFQAKADDIKQYLEKNGIESATQVLMVLKR